MHPIYLLTLLTTMGTATPIVEVKFPQRSLHNDTLHACEVAPNCEIYDTEFGPMIRFKPGMEPGSEHYKHHVEARQADISTMITYGQTSIDYGYIGASSEGGAIHHMYDICHQGSCDSTPYEVKSLKAQRWTPTIHLHLNAQGQYNGWDERNLFVEALVAASTVGEACEIKRWYEQDGPKYITGKGSLRKCTQTNFISIGRFRDGNLQGFMSVRVDTDWSDADGGWCSQLSGVLSGVAAIVAAVPGAGIAGAVSGAFGVIGAVCS